MARWWQPLANAVGRRPIPGLSGQLGASTLVLVLLAGCQATGTPFDAASDLLAPSAQQAQVIVYRSRRGHAAGTWPQLSLERRDDPSTQHQMGPLKRGGFVRWAGDATEYMLIPSGSRLIWPWATAPVLISARAGETLFVRLDMQGQQTSLLLRCGEDTHTISICEGEASRPAFEVVPRRTAVSELEGLARKERPQREGAAP